MKEMKSITIRGEMRSDGGVCWIFKSDKFPEFLVTTINPIEAIRIFITYSYIMMERNPPDPTQIEDDNSDIFKFSIEVPIFK